LSDFPPTISPEDAGHPARNLMLLSTGSQGERRAATAQLSRGKYLGVRDERGRSFLFSSKTIPGNERSVIRIVNNFSEMGVDVSMTAPILPCLGPCQPARSAAMHALVRRRW
jgi:ribonuclease J